MAPPAAHRAGRSWAAMAARRERKNNTTGVLLTRTADGKDFFQGRGSASFLKKRSKKLFTQS
jgi:hypothetical protein